MRDLGLIPGAVVGDTRPGACTAVIDTAGEIGGIHVEQSRLVARVTADGTV